MNRRKYLYGLSKLPLVAVYLLFFTVQVFFNFDIGRKSFYCGSNVFIVTLHASQAPGNLAKATTHAPSKSKLRLNKRFQPPAVPCPVAAVSETAILYIEPLTIGSYISHNYSSVILSAHSRRGPPAIA